MMKCIASPIALAPASEKLWATLLANKRYEWTPVQRLGLANALRLLDLAAEARDKGDAVQEIAARRAFAKIWARADG